MWPEIEHLRRVHVPKTRVLALWNTLELSIVSESKDRLLGSSHTNRTEVVSVRCPYEKPISFWVRASGLSLEGRCTLVENVCNFEIIPSHSPETVGILSFLQINSWQVPKAQIEDGEF